MHHHTKEVEACIAGWQEAIRKKVALVNDKRQIDAELARRSEASA
ncbi:MAG: hypothetical protein AB8H80_15725 [Planctomycetota bacterium]